MKLHQNYKHTPAVRPGCRPPGRAGPAAAPSSAAASPGSLCSCLPAAAVPADGPVREIDIKCTFCIC